MKTEKELNADILKIIMTIEEIHPELSKYIEEMNISNSRSHDGRTGLKKLQDYYDSLYALYSSCPPNVNESK